MQQTHMPALKSISFTPLWVAAFCGTVVYTGTKWRIDRKIEDRSKRPSSGDSGSHQLFSDHGIQTQQRGKTTKIRGWGNAVSLKELKKYFAVGEKNKHVL